MTQTLTNRMTTAPDQLDVNCTRLPVQETELGSMDDITGTLGIVGTILGGILIYAITHPQEVEDAIDCIGDYISEEIDKTVDYFKD